MTAGYDARYGLELLSADADHATAQVTVRDEVRQPMGLVHGGVYASLAESMCVAATATAVQGVVRGASSQTSFLRPIVQGTVHASARPRHRGRTTWVWEVDITDDDGRLCALVRMTVDIG
jgi:uncharacterized protein (TIGR00369 family)